MNILTEELEKSAISKQFQAYFKTLSPSSCWEYLLYGLPETERRNDGRLRDFWLKNYSHLDDGGWWCSGLDILAFQESQWGCLKPNSPRIVEGKPIKYEHPPKIETEAFFLGTADYWRGVIAESNQPIVITEGAKKTASLLSAGFCAVGLPGIFGGYRKDSGLIPQMGAIAQKGREIIFCFDNDAKSKTIRNVRIAVDRTAKLFRSHGCKVTVMHWGGKHKGIDDLIFHDGADRLNQIFDDRLSVTAWKKLDREPLPAPKPNPTEPDRPIEAKTSLPLETPKPMTGSVHGGIKPLNSKELLDFVQNNLGDRLKFDDLQSEILLDNEPLKIGSDLKFWFLDRFGESASKEDIYDCLTYKAKQNSFNPVAEYLNHCYKTAERGDISNLASRYFGTEDPIFDRMIELWLISAVARVFNPGCQADHTLILQGRQGAGKSTWFKVLGGPWFNDSVKDIENKDSLLTLHSSWIIELSELDRITSKKQAGTLKHFLTQREDTFRKPYGKEVEKNPRRAIFCGTVNPARFLVDDENRRFWIVPVGDSITSIDCDQLARERDSIWCGAIAAYFAGANWWPSEDEKELIRAVAKQFEDLDPWYEVVESWIADRPYVSVWEILTDLFLIPEGQIQRREQMRVAKILTMLGWTKETRRDFGGKIRRVKHNPSLDLSGKVGMVGKTIDFEGFQLDQPTEPTLERSVSEDQPTPQQRSVDTNLEKKDGSHVSQSQQGLHQPTNLNRPTSQKYSGTKKGFKYAIGDWLWDGKAKEHVKVIAFPPVGPLTAAKEYRVLSDNGEHWTKERDLYPILGI